MPRLLKHALAAFALAVICFGAVVESKANPLVLTVTNSPQTGSGGVTVTFAGTVTNPNTAGFDINFVLISPGGGGANLFANSNPFLPSGFFANPVPAGVTEAGNLLSVTLNAGIAPGLYTGFVVIRGNVLGAALLEDSNFVVVSVLVPGAPVPEPATMLLLGTGLAGVGGAILRRRKPRL